MKLSENLLLFVVILALNIFLSFSVLSSSVLADFNSWTAIRDGVLYVKMNDDSFINVKYKDIWGANGAEDRVYFQSPDGELLSKIVLRPEVDTELREDTFRASRGSGDYRLEVAGYSRRETSVSIEKNTQSVFEPAKVHFSIRIPKKGYRLYFNVPQSIDRNFAFAARFEKRGSNEFTLKSPSGKRYTFNPKKIHYSVPSHDKLTFVESEYEVGTWELIFNKPGKAAFWLDNIPNYFALNPQELFLPEFREAKSTITIQPHIIGKTPLLGVAVDAHVLKGIYEESLMTLKPDFLTYYFFPGKKVNPKIPQRAVATFPLNKEQYIIFLPPDGRKIISSPDVQKGLESLYSTKSNNDEIKTYVSFFDEPNLRMPLIEYIKQYEIFKYIYDQLGVSRDIFLSAPESSFFMDGPFLTRNKTQKGVDWAYSLYEKGLFSKHSNIQLISWHEWMHRDLISTDYYADVVEYAANKFNKLKKSPLFAITQTNISSGSDTSFYDQNTFFASLWLASAFARGASTGKLHAFGWFPFTDELEKHQKGLFSISSTQSLEDLRLTPKPVFYAFKMILDFKQDNVFSVQNNHPDLALVAMSSGEVDEISILLTNHSKRFFNVDIVDQTGISHVKNRVSTLLTLRENDVEPEINKINSLKDVMIYPESVNFLLINHK